MLSSSGRHYLKTLLLVQFCIYFIVQFYFEVCFVVEETSYIGAYSKSIFIQLSPFWPFPWENYSLNSVSDMVETTGGPSNRDKGFSCFYLSLRFLSEYFLYLLWRISFDFNFKRGIFVDTHCMCNGYIVYHFRTTLLFMRAINQIVKKVLSEYSTILRKLFKILFSRMST